MAPGVLVPFFVMCAFLVLMAFIFTWAMMKARRPRSDMVAYAAAHSWSYVPDDPSVTAGHGPASHVVRGRHDDRAVVAYEQFPAPGQRFAVTELALDRAWPALSATPVGPLTEAFASGGAPVADLLDGYVVTCPDEDFARAVLTPGVRRALGGKGLLVRDRRLVVVQPGAQTEAGLDAALALVSVAAERVSEHS
jgi:hypothetical protein